MKTTRFLAYALLLLAAASCSKGKSTAAKAGDLDVQVSIRPDPPTTGENELHIFLRDPSGKPVDGAQLAFEYDMPAMGAMAEMKGGGDVKPEGGGRYAIEYPLPMQGDWYLTLGIDAPGHPHASMKLKVSPPHKGFTVEGRAGGGGGSPGPKVIEVSPERQQLIGVTFGTVEERPLTVALRAAGRIEVDERKLADITLKYEAYVEKLFVGETGKTVKEGQPLLRLYSPDLLAAEEELLSARRSGGAPEIVDATARRLAYWDLSREQIAELERRGKADGKVTISSPATGVVLEKAVVEGTHVMPGSSLYRIGNLGRVWVQAAVYERDAPLVSIGQPAKVSLPSLAGESAEARVTFVAPTVDEKTRTVGARLELVNAKLLLKPGMFADVLIDAPLGPRLSVPDSALLISGQHRYAFVDRGEGKIEAVEVEVGALAGDYDEVRSGLAKGDRVALGATFLLSSEAKLRDALPRWRTP
ncbi:MAG TPA: efflux RND transporter periplasmic adaptor subunit [Candidatus Sulfotelmatobacter sp.]|nr:efflux RND transporter periplasmic adaptor subunit [Candidatus Sulfotelmatobacter sp.]